LKVAGVDVVHCVLMLAEWSFPYGALRVARWSATNGRLTWACYKQTTQKGTFSTALHDAVVIYKWIAYCSYYIVTACRVQCMLYNSSVQCIRGIYVIALYKSTFTYLENVLYIKMLSLLSGAKLLCWILSWLTILHT